MKQGKLRLMMRRAAGHWGGHYMGNGRASPRPPAGTRPPPLPSGLGGLLGLRPCDPQGLSWKIMEAIHTPYCKEKYPLCLYAQ